MEDITNIDELRARIEELKAKKDLQEELILQDVYETYDSLKPANIFRTVFSELSSTPDILENIFSNIASIVAGYLSRKVFVRGSGNIFKRIMGTLTQFGITYYVSTHARQIKEKLTEIVELFTGSEMESGNEKRPENGEEESEMENEDSTSEVQP